QLAVFRFAGSTRNDEINRTFNIRHIEAAYLKKSTEMIRLDRAAEAPLHIIARAGGHACQLARKRQGSAGNIFDIKARNAERARAKRQFCLDTFHPLPEKREIFRMKPQSNVVRIKPCERVAPFWQKRGQRFEVKARNIEIRTNGRPLSRCIDTELAAQRRRCKIARIGS